jgi:PAS domain S-box-containing protein
MGTKIISDHFNPGRLVHYLNSNVVKKLQSVAISNTLALKKYFNHIYNYLTSNDAIMLDTNGSVLSWNKTCEKIHGYTEPEILGQHLNIFYLPQDRQAHLPEHLIETACKQGKAVHKGKWVRKDGTTFYGSMFITTIKSMNNEVVGYMEFLREIKEPETE